MNRSPKAWVAIYVETHAQRLHVDPTMRRQGHSIHTHQCLEPNMFYGHSRGMNMSNLCDLSDGTDSASDIGSMKACRESGLIGEQGPSLSWIAHRILWSAPTTLRSSPTSLLYGPTGRYWLCC